MGAKPIELCPWKTVRTAKISDPFCVRIVFGDAIVGANPKVSSIILEDAADVVISQSLDFGCRFVTILPWLEAMKTSSVGAEPHASFGVLVDLRDPGVLKSVWSIAMGGIAGEIIRFSVVTADAHSRANPDRIVLSFIQGPDLVVA